MTENSVLVRTAIRAALLANGEILNVYHRSDPGEVIRKSDDSPLTEADLGSNRVIRETLTSAFPGIPFLSEETAEIPYAVRTEYPRFWMVDPLDGTKEFIRRNGEFTVNIALIEKGRPVLSVVTVPVTGEVYWAVRGHGAFRDADHPVRLRVTTFRMADPGLRLVASRSHRDADTESFMNRFDQPVIRSAGSSLKILLLASGQAEIYPRFAPTMEWDIAAADLILEEAGGAVLNAETGKPLTYNKPDLHNPFFIAWGHCADRPVTG